MTATHVCTVHSVYNDKQIMRVVRFVRKHWRRISKVASTPVFCRRAISSIARCDGGYWPVNRCGDYTPLLNAVQKAFPGAKKIIEVLDDVIETMAFGYWNGEGACDDREEHGEQP